ncbi:unnamed protein product [Cuscuta epithymum]|uniref:Uncharacterized protein n=1 Tax=Cuscuta epithymum TaxID=186058 RepID=A0AAV0CC85_9ASTE|nr:unnamed protein product [Cuscuta epithymum]
MTLFFMKKNIYMRGSEVVGWKILAQTVKPAHAKDIISISFISTTVISCSSTTKVQFFYQVPTSCFLSFSSHLLFCKKRLGDLHTQSFVSVPDLTYQKLCN